MDIAAAVRQALVDDIAAMHAVRLAVRENRLVHSRVVEADYVGAIAPPGRGWVVAARGETVGFAVANAATGNIWALFVHPAHEGRGYGRRLHDTMVEWLWSSGCDSLWLTTEPGTRAERFYRAAGWTYAGASERGEARFELRRAR